MRGREIYRYSLAFQQKVVDEVESGRKSVEEARRLYEIGGSHTIARWIKKLGKNELLNRVVRIEMKDEKDRVKELEKEKRELERALAKTQVRLIAMECLVEVAEEHYKADFKKNFGEKLSGEEESKESE